MEKKTKLFAFCGSVVVIFVVLIFCTVSEKTVRQIKPTMQTYNRWIIKIPGKNAIEVRELPKIVFNAFLNKKKEDKLTENNKANGGFARAYSEAHVEKFDSNRHPTEPGVYTEGHYEKIPNSPASDVAQVRGFATGGSCIEGCSETNPKNTASDEVYVGR